MDGAPYDVLVIDPSLSRVGPMTLPDWVGAVNTKNVEYSAVSLTQADINEMQTVRVLGGGDPIDALVFLLPYGVPPLSDIGGSGFRVEPDPHEGVRHFAHMRMDEIFRIIGDT